MTNKERAIEKINKYLTQQFICDPELLPDDECESEAKKILDILKSLGMIFKAKDQSLPEYDYELYRMPSSCVLLVQKIMLKADWVKVEKE